MYCSKCGSQNNDNAYKCINCGEILSQISGSGPTQIPNYLVQSILVTIFCCMPLGIPAIVYSAQVNGLVRSGDIQGARESSEKAKGWGWWSFGIGIVLCFFYFLLGVAGL